MLYWHTILDNLIRNSRGSLFRHTLYILTTSAATFKCTCFCINSITMDTLTVMHYAVLYK